MTNDERNPKPDSRSALWWAIARSSCGFRYSCGFRHSSFGFENGGSWRADFASAHRIGVPHQPRATAPGQPPPKQLKRQTARVNFRDMPYRPKPLPVQLLEAAKLAVFQYSGRPALVSQRISRMARLVSGARDPYSGFVSWPVRISQSR